MADENDTAEENEPQKKGRASNEAPQEASSPNPAATAGMASCLTGVILLLLVLCTWFAFWWNPALIPAGMAWDAWSIALVIILLIVIPIVVFRAVTLWIMGEGPRFVDVDFSWRVGIDEMAKQGISLNSAPLFLVVGGGSEKLRKNLMAASGMDFVVDGVPNRQAPLHWYASRDAIYLYIDDAAWTNLAARQYRSALASPRGKKGPMDLPQDAGSGGGRPAPMIATLVPGAGKQSAPKPSGQEQDATDLPGDDAPAQTPSTRPSPGGRPAAYLGTLNPSQVQPPSAQDTRSGGAPAAPPRRVHRAGSEKSSLQLRRLEAVCSKLRRFRQPVCPINGILILLPFDLLQASRSDIEEVERALSADLATTQRELQIRCPVTALVVAMEQEKGFCELIRRIGREHAARQRFGQRFDLRRLPSVEELQRFSLYACGVFEDWVYTLFKEDEVLTHPGNPALYNLLCKVRRSFQARLSDVLSKGFGFDPQSDTAPILFSGCYFAATGAKPERQAFVSGVLSKLREEQEDLEWTDAALIADTNRARTALIGWGLVVLLAILGALAYTFLL